MLLRWSVRLVDEDRVASPVPSAEDMMRPKDELREQTLKAGGGERSGDALRRSTCILVDGMLWILSFLPAHMLRVTSQAFVSPGTDVRVTCVCRECDMVRRL